LDDTPGAERIHLNHKTNTFFEIAPDGSKVTKVQGDNYEIYIKDNNIHVKGQCNITVDGNAGIYVKGDATQKVDGSVKWNVGGDVNMQIAGKFIAKASQFNLTGDVYQTGNMNISGSVTATGDVKGGGISLDNHVHPDPQGGTTGKPQ
jgi:hypothetical protein